MNDKPWIRFRSEDGAYRAAALRRACEIAAELADDIGPGGVGRLVTGACGGPDACEGYFCSRLRDAGLSEERIKSEVAVVRARAERTPDVVLRAMLAAYEAALFAAHVAYMRGERTFDAARKVDRLSADTDAVRGAAAWVSAGNADIGLSEYRKADYEARLRGDRPLNAPPPEV